MVRPSRPTRPALSRAASFQTAGRRSAAGRGRRAGVDRFDDLRDAIAGPSGWPAPGQQSPDPTVVGLPGPDGGGLGDTVGTPRPPEAPAAPGGPGSLPPPGGRGGGGGGGGGRGFDGDPPMGRRPSGEHPAKRRSFVWRWRRAFFLVALLGLVVMAAGGAVVANTELPEPDPLAQSTFICPAGVQAGQCTGQSAMAKIQGGEDRVNVTYDQLPQVLIDAVVAMEDRDFFDHSGIDPVGIGRALYRDLRGDGVQQGGSTITQQYVKNAFLSPERALTRKVREAVLAVKLEQQWSKQRILEGYLNTIYFGRGAYGVQAASQAYFGKGVQDENFGLAEAAYLAGLIRAPERADASEHPDEARRRRRTALVAMEEEGYISEDELAMADAVSFDDPNYFRPRQGQRKFLTNQPYRDQGGDYITQYVNQLLQREPFNFTEDEIYGSGLRVYTSIDPQMQGMAWDAVASTLTDPEDPQAALVAVDDQGYIRAMVGGRGFVPAQSELNYALQGRAVGSTYKPIALAQALVDGWSLDSRFNAPSVLNIPPEDNPCGDPWEVNNYDESDSGTLDLVGATRESSNTAYAQIVGELGVERVNEMAHRLGIDGDLQNCLPVVLGSDNATVLEMATVFSTFANRGVRKTPQIITRVERLEEDGSVTVLHDQDLRPRGDEVLAPDKADLVTHSLRSVIEEGTGTGADIGRPAAGKTGTTTNNKDAWFVGYVPRLTAAVWMGYPEANWDDPETDERDLQLMPMNSRGRPVQGRAVTGGSFPAEIWRKFMSSVTEARQMNDSFPELSDEALHSGQVHGSANWTGDGGGNGGGNDGEWMPGIPPPSVPLPPDTSAPPSSTPDTTPSNTRPTVTLPTTTEPTTTIPTTRPSITSPPITPPTTEDDEWPPGPP